ncbi:hypothetical protein [Amycolatopsis minnesotensis]
MLRPSSGPRSTRGSTPVCRIAPGSMTEVSCSTSASFASSVVAVQ